MLKVLNSIQLTWEMATVISKIEVYFIYLAD